MSPAPRLRPAPILSASRGLVLLCDGLGRAVLHELALHGPLTRPVLTARLHAGQTRVYESLRVLGDAGLVEARAGGRAARHQVTDSGRALLEVAGRVERWSAGHPGGALEAAVGWRAFEDVGEAWREAIVEWIVRLAPTEADAARGLPGYEGRRLPDLLATMTAAGMVEQRRGRDGRSHYRLSAWTARAIGPLAAIARWESRFLPPGGAAIEVEDAVVAILASLPLVRPAGEAGVVLTLTVEAPRAPAGGRRTGTVWARLRRGRAVGLGEGAPPRPADGWAAGSFEDWLAAVLDGRPRALRLEGRDPAAVRALVAVVAELHEQLVGSGP